MTNCVAPGNVYASYDNDKYCESILPTELASGLINGDWSILDYINDEEYSLTATSTLGDITGVETEDNGDTSTADTLTSGNPIKGQLSSVNDMDVYSIVTTSTGTIDIDFDSPTNNSYTDYFTITLSDGINTISSQKTGVDTSFSAGVEAGTYYVFVDPASNYSFNDEEYSLTATSSLGDTSEFIIV